MELHECQIGMIVTNIKESYNYDCTKKYNPYKRIGYISGLSMSNIEEVIPSVKWADDGTEMPIHHSNIEKYEGK